jgi:hypothetical protein
MSGAHRRPGEAGAGAYARFLAVTAAWVIGFFAAVAGLIWLFRSGTTLMWSVALLIPAVIQLVQGLARGTPTMAWVGAGGVILFSWQILSEVTHHPAGGLGGFLVRTVAMVCLGIGFVLLVRETRLGHMWKAIWTRLASGSGDDGPARPG